MAYVYLLDLYKQIEDRLNNAKAGLENSGADELVAGFEKGRIDALNEIKGFLEDNFNSKLPRRIRESLKRRQQ